MILIVLVTNKHLFLRVSSRRGTDSSVSFRSWGPKKGGSKYGRHLRTNRTGTFSREKERVCTEKDRGPLCSYKIESGTGP